MNKIIQTLKKAIPVMLLLAGTIVFAIYYAGKDAVKSGVIEGYNMGVEIILTMFIAFIFSGLVMKLIPEDMINRWLGKNAGVRGYVLALLGGMITPAGPAVIYPVIGMMVKKRCSVGIISTFLSSWGMLGLIRSVAWGVPLLGAKLVTVMLIVALPSPIIIGVIMNWIYHKFDLSMEKDNSKIDAAILKIKTEEM